MCGWGTNGEYMGRGDAVMRLLEGLCEPQALALTKDGHPTIRFIYELTPGHLA